MFQKIKRKIASTLKGHVKTNINQPIFQVEIAILDELVGFTHARYLISWFFVIQS